MMSMSEVEQTLAYYDTHAASFVERTGQVAFSSMQEAFAAHIPSGGRILDLGCGSGRDSQAFLARGFQVVAVDGSAVLCELASQRIGQKVLHATFQTYEPQGTFDGIWACASLLHLEIPAICQVLQNISPHLRMGGCYYLSFKYGTFSGMRHGRYFTDMTEDRFQMILQRVPELQMLEQYQTEDVRPARKGERWLNVFLKKGDA